MDERVKFIARVLDGETMSRLCDEFSISRKTGYKDPARQLGVGPSASDFAERLAQIDWLPVRRSETS